MCVTLRLDDRWERVVLSGHVGGEYHRPDSRIGTIEMEGRQAQDGQVSPWCLRSLRWSVGGAGLGLWSLRGRHEAGFQWAQLCSVME